MNWETILKRQSNWSRTSAPNLRLTPEEAVVLYEQAPLHALMQAAHKRRLAMHPDGKVTYLVDRNINYTNVCTINCQFCSFTDRPAMPRPTLKPTKKSQGVFVNWKPLVAREF